MRPYDPCDRPWRTSAMGASRLRASGGETRRAAAPFDPRWLPRRQGKRHSEPLNGALVGYDETLGQGGSICTRFGCPPRTIVVTFNAGLALQTGLRSSNASSFTPQKFETCPDWGATPHNPYSTPVLIADFSIRPETRDQQGYRGVIQRVSHAILRFQFETVPLCARVLSTLIHTETNT